MAGDQIRLTPMGGVKAFSCRGCGGQISLLAPGQSIAAACRHCGAVTDLTNENFSILSRYKDATPRNPRYEIGSKAIFEGKTWLLIGFMVRTVKLYDFIWEEYLLFNPMYGYRFLAHAYGHWSWIKMVQDVPFGSLKSNFVSYQGKQFKFLTSGEAQVIFVLGEFYWQVKVGDVAMTRDLVAPPRLLSVEIESGGMIWSEGQYLEPSDVEKGFGMPPEPKMSRRTVGANQPNSYRDNLKRILPVWILSVVLLFALFIGISKTSSTANVLEQSFAFPDTVDRISPSFELAGAMQNVEVKAVAESGLDNHWMYFSGVLHSLTTNENYDFELEAGYYYGVTDGESWSEGSKAAKTIMNEVPAGEYELVVSSLSDSVGSATISLRRGVTIESNVFIIFILLSLLPLYLFIRSNRFEKSRKE